MNELPVLKVKRICGTCGHWKTGACPGSATTFTDRCNLWQQRGKPTQAESTEQSPEHEARRWELFELFIQVAAATHGYVLNHAARVDCLQEANEALKVYEQRGECK
jgi:hypothetical protein